MSSKPNPYLSLLDTILRLVYIGLGQIKKTQQQIQNELDEIHHLISQGASDDYIMKNKDIERRTYYRYKKRLYKQVAKQYEEKRLEDYYYDILVCKERLTHDRVNATAKANETGNPLWGQLSAELAVSILKLEYEGIASLHNGRFKQLEEKAGYIELKPASTDVPTAEANGLDQQRTGTNDPDPNAVF